jgi:uncharacterized delta-60 repeat protein
MTFTQWVRLLSGSRTSRPTPRRWPSRQPASRWGRQLERLEDRRLMAFGETGLVTTDHFATGDDRIEGVVVQADGKIVAAGNSGLARYNADGSLDETSFNAGGTQPGVFTVAQGRDAYYDVALQADGKIVAVGERLGDHWDFLITRLTAAGAPDITFGDNGHVTLAWKNTTTAEQLDAVAIQPDGKIVVVGHGTAGYPGWYVMRLHPDGRLDNSFDRDGKVTTAFGAKTGNETANAVAVQPDGKILVAGRVSVYPNGSTWHYDFAVARYNANGSLDTTFGQGGKVRTDFASDVGQTLSREEAHGIALQADGKIVVGGKAAGGVTFTPDFTALVRYNSNGSLDATFGGDGKVSRSGGGSEAVAIQSDGKIVVAGNGTWVERYNANGSPDTSFDGDGRLETYNESAPLFLHSIRDVALQADGKIVVGGASGNEPTLFGLLRVNPDGSPDAAAPLAAETSTSADGSMESAVAVDGSVESPIDGWLNAWLAEQFDSPSARGKRRR